MDILTTTLRAFYLLTSGFSERWSDAGYPIKIYNSRPDTSAIVAVVFLGIASVMV